MGGQGLRTGGRGGGSPPKRRREGRRAGGRGEGVAALGGQPHRTERKGGVIARAGDFRIGTHTGIGERLRDPRSGKEKIPLTETNCTFFVKRLVLF